MVDKGLNRGYNEENLLEALKERTKKRSCYLPLGTIIEGSLQAKLACLAWRQPTPHPEFAGSVVVDGPKRTLSGPVHLHGFSRELWFAIAPPPGPFHARPSARS